jgi:hypothetical protein
MGHPFLFRRGLGLHNLEAEVAHIANATGDPVDMLLDRDDQGMPNRARSRPFP